MLATSSSPDALSSRDLAVSLKPTESSAARAGPAWVVVTVQNATAEPITAAGVPFIVLTNRAGASWWAPFDFGSRAPLDANAVSTLVNAAGVTSTARVNLAALPWAKSIAGVWPGEPLNAVVPAGSYKVRFTFEVQGNPKVTRTSSPASIFLK
jgi:hypothetical protein